MACRNAYKKTANLFLNSAGNIVERLLFGVDSEVRSDILLQNNIDLFEWVIRNKVYPNFWGRNMVGENALTTEEIDFLHGKACKIAPLYKSSEEKKSEEQGTDLAESIVRKAKELEIPKGTAIFLDIDENESSTRDFMRGYAKKMMERGYIPAFRANTDAKYGFDREFSRGMQTDREIFAECLVWATSPTVKEYDRITTTHLIHPDNWRPFAPSGVHRKEISVWQYGKNCHLIDDDEDRETTFNLNLIRTHQVLIEKMF